MVVTMSIRGVIIIFGGGGGGVIVVVVFGQSKSGPFSRNRPPTELHPGPPLIHMRRGMYNSDPDPAPPLPPFLPSPLCPRPSVEWIV